MTKITTVQAAHTYGVLDPLMVDRRDTKFVGGSLSDGLNIVLLPQGGYTDRGGTTDKAGARRKLSAIAVTAAMLTLANGGTAADLIAGEAQTMADATGSRFVLVEVDFGADTAVQFIDAKKIGISDSGDDAAIVAEYYDGAAWQSFGVAAKLTVDAYTRRIAAGAPGTDPVTAQKFRLAIDASGDASGDATLSGIAFHVESDTLSDGVVRRYASGDGTAYQLVLTDMNVDIFKAGVWQAAAALPAEEAIIRQLKPEPKLDTVLVFHRKMAPQRLFRLGAATEWACDPIEFAHMPRYDYGGVYTNGVNEVQQIQLFSVAVADTFQLTIEGLTTTAIEKGIDAATTAASIKTAIEALSNVEPGITVVAVSSHGANTFNVEFSGNGNKWRDWLTMTGTALNDDGYVTVRGMTEGKAGGEDIMSEVRGWPAVGRFAQQRLVMAGLDSLPNTMLASVEGDPFNLNTDLASAVSAFSYDIEASENNAIVDIVVSRTLLFLGSQQAVYLKGDKLSATEAPQFGASDTPGAKAEVPPVSSDNAIFYVQAQGTSLRNLSYTELEQNYVSENASVLSAFLIRDPVDMTRRRAASRLDSDLIMMANAGGTATVLTMMRTQEVSGFAPWSTDGDFVSLVTDSDNDTWMLVRRPLGDGETLRLELFEPDKLLDEAVELTLSPASDTLTGLSRFNGRSVWVVAADQIFGPYTVADAEVTLPEVVSSARVGTWIAPLATDPPVSLEEETRSRQARLKRVNRAVIAVLDTTSLAIAANGGDAINLPLIANDAVVLDQGPLAAPYSGKIEADGMHGFTDTGSLTVTQTWPGFMTVRSLTKNVAA